MIMKRSAIAEHLTAFLLAAAMLCSSFPGVRAEGAMAEGGVPSLTPRLPKTVTEYNVDFETKAWVPIGQPTPYSNAGFAAIQPRHSPPRVL